MTATHTIPERLALLAAGLVFAAVAAFGLIHVAPNRELFPQNEIMGTLGLYWAAILLFVGVWLIADWRRKRRAATAAFRCVSEYVASWPSVAVTHNCHTVCERTGDQLWDWSDVRVGARGHCGDCPNLMRQLVQSQPDPTSELQRHLTDALAVMLRHPSLTVDAVTLKLLARRPKPVRDEKGRWRKAD